MTEQRADRNITMSGVSGLGTSVPGVSAEADGRRELRERSISSMFTGPSCRRWMRTQQKLMLMSSVLPDRLCGSLLSTPLPSLALVPTPSLLSPRESVPCLVPETSSENNGFSLTASRVTIHLAHNFITLAAWKVWLRNQQRKLC